MNLTDTQLDILLREYEKEASLMFCPSTVPHGDRVQIILLASILKELRKLRAERHG